MMVGRKVILRVERPAANQRTRPVVEQEVARGVMQEAKQGIEPGADHGGEENARHGTEEKAYHRTEQNAKHATDDEPVLLETRGLKVTDRNGRTRLVDINLHVRAGEILGVVGVEGNGQLELEEVITGLRAPSAGSVKICGEELWTGSNPTTPRRFRALGGAHIPSDRLRRGIITSLPLTRNAILGRQREAPFVRRKWIGGVLAFNAIRRHTAGLIDRFDVRTASVESAAGSLSGGNQQKLVVGREFSFDPQVIVAAQPTRGVDVGAIEQIHQELLDMRAAGKAILLISAELDELLSLSDRLVILYEGAIVAEGRTEDFTETQLGLLMAGGGRCG